MYYITDYWTKWVDEEEIVSNFFPAILIPHHRQKLCNTLNDRFCKQMGIQHRSWMSYEEV